MKRILFVDDEPHLLQGLQRLFRPHRNEWQMSFANSGKEALTLLDKETFDVVVTDMRMPEMDGARLLASVQEKHPSVVRIVLSGHVDMEAAIRAVPVAHQFLSKPCDPEKLRAAIQRACDCREKLSHEDIRNVTGAVGKLPSLPATCASLMTALQDPDVDLVRIAKIIEKDVGITAKILQLVNSAFFGVQNEVTNVNTAVNYLGLETLKQLVLSAEILRTFQPTPSFANWLSSFEEHSCLSAQIAARLPISANLASSAVVGSLLHDTGKLVLATRLPSQYEMAVRVAAQEGLPLYQVEERVMGVNHAQVGAYLLDLWGLPGSIVEAVRAHHQPSLVPAAPRQLNIVAIIHIVNALAHELKQPLAAGGPDLLDHDYIASLDLTDNIPAWREIAQFAVSLCAAR